jgi:hypothetical protein
LAAAVTKAVLAGPEPRLYSGANLSPLGGAASSSTFVDPKHEAMALAGVQATWGHTGRVQALASSDFTTITPTFDWGKGLGDLPDSTPYLRPFAITGNLSVDFPTKVQSNRNPNANNLNYGFAIEYSLEYTFSTMFGTSASAGRSIT